MAKNKKTHHRPGPGKPRGATYAQVLAHKAAVRKGLEQAARDATVQVQADRPHHRCKAHRPGNRQFCGVACGVSG